MKNKVQTLGSIAARRFGLLFVALFVLVVSTFGSYATAPADIDGVISAVSGYLTAAMVVGIGALLYVIGRKIVRKVT